MPRRVHEDVVRRVVRPVERELEPVVAELENAMAVESQRRRRSVGVAGFMEQPAGLHMGHPHDVVTEDR
jgi:hypothetical protein